MESILFLYGSQTGAAQSIVENFHNKAQQLGYKSTMSTLSDYSNSNFLSAKLTVIVCSTTGNGDPPNNAEDFWRFIRRRTHPKDMLAHQSFTCLGLGDTNYDKFCYAAKTIVKRMTELGATTFLAPDFADEAMGLETVVAPWEEKLWESLRSVMKQPSSAVTSNILPPPLSITITSADNSELLTNSDTVDMEHHVPLSPLSFMHNQQHINQEREKRRLAEIAAENTHAGGRKDAHHLKLPSEISDMNYLTLPSDSDSTSSPLERYAREAAMRVSTMNFTSTQKPEVETSKFINSPFASPHYVCSGKSSILPENIVGLAELAGDFEFPAVESYKAKKLFPQPPKESVFLQIRGVEQAEIVQGIATQSSASDPGSQKSHHLPADPSTPLSTSSTSTSVPASNVQSPPLLLGKCPERPITLRLLDAELLASSPNRKIIIVILDASDTPLFNGWTPGDALSIIAPNREDWVDFVASRFVDAQGSPLSSSTPLVLTDSFGVPFSKDCNSSSVNTGVARAGALSVPSHLLATLTLGSLLAWSVDMRQQPKKTLVRLMADYATDPAEQRMLMYLCAREGAELWKRFIEAQALGFCALLALFPSVRLPLLAFSAFAPNAPRPYSLCSSAIQDPRRLSVAFKVVKYDIPSPHSSDKDDLSISNKKIEVEGHATNYLDALVTRLLDPSVDHSSPMRVLAFLRPAREFSPPASLETPMIMVAAGTGIAPFIGFLEERRARQAALHRAASAVSTGNWRGLKVKGPAVSPSHQSLHASASFGNLSGIDRATSSRSSVGVHSIVGARPATNTLFFGNRHPSVDFLFQKELEEMKNSGILQNLYTAWSRPNDYASATSSATTKQKQYVQDVILERGPEVAELILRHGAYVFVCGDGLSMSKAVFQAFVTVLARWGGEVSERINLMNGNPIVPANTSFETGSASSYSNSVKRSSSVQSLHSPIIEIEEQAEEFLNTLISEGRYQKDVWG